MKIKIIYASIALLMVSFVVEGNCKLKSPEIVKLRVRYGSDPEDRSADEIVLFRSDGSTTLLTDNKVMDGCPVVSYDDSTVSFVRAEDSNGDGVVNFLDHAELWLIDLESGQETRIARDVVDPSATSWHPSKMCLTFVADRKNGERGLFVYHVLTKELEYLRGGAESGSAWSPKGGFIAYYDAKNRVCLYDLKARSKRVLSGDVGEETPVLFWLTDNRLMFVDKLAKAYAYDPETGHSKEVQTNEMFRRVVIQSVFGWSRKIEPQKGIKKNKDAHDS